MCGVGKRTRLYVCEFHPEAVRAQCGAGRLNIHESEPDDGRGIHGAGLSAVEAGRAHPHCAGAQLEASARIMLESWKRHLERNLAEGRGDISYAKEQIRRYERYLERLNTF